MTLVIAHRGASADAPENTLAAFELAVAQRADMIETDLHLTADGEIAIWHDDDVDGVPVGRQTLEELRTRRPDLATLEETLAAFGQRIPFNLELKQSGRRDYVGLEARVLEVVRRFALVEPPLYSSFGERVLARLRDLDATARIGVLVSPSIARKGGFEERARALKAEAINPSIRIASEPAVRGFRAAGFRVNVYTVDEPEVQRRLIGWGVEGIFTNRPAQMRALCDAQ
jgi:glycerophosphoryl diester phosphodiesterase